MYPLRARPELESRFLLFLLLAEHFSRFAEIVSTRSGFPKINRIELSEYAAALPPLPEQQAIADVLDTLDDAIRKTEEVIAKLKQVKQGLLHDLLTRGIDDNGELRDPERHPEQFKDSPLGRIPKEWAAATIRSVVDPTPGSSTIGPFGSNLVAADYRHEGHPVVFVRDIGEDGLAWRSDVFVDDAKARELSSHNVIGGDVVVTKMGDPPGVACVYPNWMPQGIITADVIRLRLAETKARPLWAASAMNSSCFAKQVQAIMGGVTRSKLTLRDFRDLLLPTPPIEEQEAIVEAAQGARCRLQLESSHVSRLRLLKQGLMDDLLTGRVRVTPLLEDGAP